MIKMGASDPWKSASDPWSVSAPDELQNRPLVLRSGVLGPSKLIHT